MDRPRNIDLTGSSYSDLSLPMHSPTSLAPPRAGDVPPALSPLDAFALQSRLLARKFEVESQDGKRLSRLPALTIQNEFARRPSYFRKMSDFSSAIEETPASAREERSGQMGLLQQIPIHARPQSHYPLFEGDESTALHTKFKPALSGVGEESESPSRPSQSYFGIPRAQSPDQVKTQVQRSTPTTPSGPPRAPPTPPRSVDALSVGSLYVSSPKDALKPPKSSLPLNAMRNSPTIRSLYDSSDEMEAISRGGSVVSLPPQNLSSNSSYSTSQSPAIPLQNAFPRSPSVASDKSWASGFKSSLNSPRPMSGLGRPSMDQRSVTEGDTYFHGQGGRQGTMDSTSTGLSLDVPSRRDTGDSPLTPMSVNLPKTPVNIASADYFPIATDSNGNNTGSSYTYTKYALPRNRKITRNSIGPSEFALQQFDWADDFDSSGISLDRSQSPLGQQRPVLPDSPTRVTVQRSRTSSTPVDLSPPRQRRVLHKKVASDPRSATIRHVGDVPAPDFVTAKATSPSAAPSVAPTADTTTSDASNSTIKAALSATAPFHSKSSFQELTTEEHLQKGIELHESGALPQSTYHLRIAARNGHPTAMLLYALACRHGWGMRPNQADGVKWLQRAVDSAQLELADDEDVISRGSGGPETLHDRRTHNARFALSVYELGMSYMNGWGVRQDRALALRCFEVAGNWGDADAMAEAAFCYAEGVGCKKDLRRAARLYRAAEAMGMSMAGNGWIYKDKYMDGNSPPGSGTLGRDRGSKFTPNSGSRPNSAAGGSNKKTDKSRTRSIFGRKKSFPNAPAPELS